MDAITFLVGQRRGSRLRPTPFLMMLTLAALGGCMWSDESPESAGQRLEDTPSGEIDTSLRSPSTDAVSPQSQATASPALRRPETVAEWYEWSEAYSELQEIRWHERVSTCMQQKGFDYRREVERNPSADMPGEGHVGVYTDFGMSSMLYMLLNDRLLGPTDTLPPALDSAYVTALGAEFGGGDTGCFSEVAPPDYDTVDKVDDYLDENWPIEVDREQDWAHCMTERGYQVVPSGFASVSDAITAFTLERFAERGFELTSTLQLNIASEKELPSQHVEAVLNEVFAYELAIAEANEHCQNVTGYRDAVDARFAALLADLDTSIFKFE